MKTLMTTLAVAIALMTLTLSAQAEQEVDLAGCSAELKAYFGNDTEFTLVDKRRNLYGTRVRVAARQDADNAYFATCWVPDDDASGFGGDGVRPLLAVSPSRGILLTE